MDAQAALKLHCPYMSSDPFLRYVAQMSPVVLKVLNDYDSFAYHSDLIYRIASLTSVSPLIDSSSLFKHRPVCFDVKYKLNLKLISENAKRTRTI